jgi:hypothetical protein
MYVNYELVTQAFIAKGFKVIVFSHDDLIHGLSWKEGNNSLSETDDVREFESYEYDLLMVEQLDFWDNYTVRQ